VRKVRKQKNIGDSYQKNEGIKRKKRRKGKKED